METKLTYGKYMADGINEFRKNKSNQPPMKQGSSDDFQTPPEALEPLIPFLNKDWTIWECANGRGNLSKSLRERESSKW